MGELGIEQIFARSPQAKGRVERMNGTFQDRLVSELRLAGAATIDQANTVLQDFLPRFNNSVPSACPAVPGRLSFLVTPPCIWNGSSASNTCARWPGTTPSNTSCAPCSCFQPRDRPSYAGVKVDVLEQSDGQLMVQHEGKAITHQEAPPKAGALRAAQGALAPYSRTGPGGQEPEPAWSHQVATAAPGRFGSTRRPTDE